MFVLSKVPELGDTVFIVLRKQKLIFLHWYHHVTVLVYCWYSFSEYTAPARWFVVMNFVVHSLMYSYYALKAMRIRVARSVAMVITSLQLLQMVVGCLVNYTAFTFKTKGMSCGVSETNLRLSLLMYSSYFILFARFFYNAYFAQSERKFCPVEKEFQVNQKIFSPELLQTKQCNQDDIQEGQLREGSESEGKTEREDEKE